MLIALGLLLAVSAPAGTAEEAARSSAMAQSLGKAVAYEQVRCINLAKRGLLELADIEHFILLAGPDKVRQLKKLEDLP